MVSQKTSNSITRPYVSSNERQATTNQTGEVIVPNVLANLVRPDLMEILFIIIQARASHRRWSRSSLIKDGRVHHGMACPTQVTSIAVMEVTPNSPDSSTLGTVIKQITVPHILYKDSSMKGKSFRQFYLRKYSFLTESSKVTNFIIGRLLASPCQSPLIQCSCVTGYSPKIIVRVSSTY